MPLSDNILQKIHLLIDRSEALTYLLSDADVISEQKKYTQLSKEYADIQPVLEHFKEWEKLQDDQKTALEWCKSGDTELKNAGQEELKTIKDAILSIEENIQISLIPEDPLDNADIYLEIRAGTGGDEANLFVGDLLRMYTRYVELKKWSFDIITKKESPVGGYKEAIILIKGSQIYSHFKFESGAHRVQRVPETESQGRIHTSACTVAILPVVSDIESIDINKADLRIDTYRSSGAGGQHVNTTDSAVRITHLPTGVVVECQDERSQHKNKAKAMALLNAKILQVKQAERSQSIADSRKTLVGSGDRSERIRTYNYPQGRITDHRINLTLYKLNDCLEGNLDDVITPLRKEHQLSLLIELNDDNFHSN